jgi:hypothetical protein
MIPRFFLLPVIAMAGMSERSGTSAPQEPNDSDDVPDVSSDEDDTGDRPSELERRKRYRVMEDFLSSFSRDMLPSEWAPQQGGTFSITPQTSSSQSGGWTAPSDLELTLMQWACYSPDRDLISCIEKMKSSIELAILFIQKLRRRFGTAFEQYQESQLDGSELAKKLLFLSKEAERDRQWRTAPSLDRLTSNERTGYHNSLFDTLLKALQHIVQFADWPAPPPTLTNTMFRDVFVLDNDHDIMLDTFEAILNSAAGVIPDMQVARDIAELLRRYGAREDYQVRYRRIFHITG